jgi:hypothetical protein
MRDLHQAAQGMTATQLTEEMAHALLFGEIDTRREQGDDFMKYYYVPGEYYVHIDYQHKMKNELAKVRKQAKENIQVGDTSVLINLSEMLQVAEGNVNLKHLQAALALAADSQSVVIALECFYNRELQQGLVRAGYLRTACALRVFSDGHMGWDMPGLSLDERAKRLGRMRRLYVRMLGSRMYSVSGK